MHAWNVLQPHFPFGFSIWVFSVMSERSGFPKRFIDILYSFATTLLLNENIATGMLFHKNDITDDVFVNNDIIAVQQRAGELVHAVARWFGF